MGPDGVENEGDDKPSPDSLEAYYEQNGCDWGAGDLFCIGGGKVAWISQEEKLGGPFVAIKARLDDTLEQYEIDLDAGSEIPAGLAGSELVIVTAYGGLGSDPRQVRPSGTCVPFPMWVTRKVSRRSRSACRRGSALRGPPIPPPSGGRSYRHRGVLNGARLLSICHP